MSTPATGSAQRGTQQRRQPEQSTFSNLVGVAQKALLAYVAVQLATNYLFPKAATPTPLPPPTNQVPQAVTGPGAGQPIFGIPTSANPFYPLNTTLSLSIYITNSGSRLGIFDPTRSKDVILAEPIIWEDIKWGNWKDERAWSGSVNLPRSVQTNSSSLWAHLYLAVNGTSPDPNSPKFNPKLVHHIRHHLTKYRKLKKIRKEKNLLSSKPGEEEEEEEVHDPKDDLLAPHWYPNITYALISDPATVPFSQLPPPMRQHVYLAPGLADETGTVGYYYPIVFPNEFWHLSTYLKPYSSANTTLPLHINFHPLSFFKFQLYSTLAHSFEQQTTSGAGAGATGAELDEMKRMLIETSPWLLITTAIVSVLHMVFEMLAFTSDVSHWRKKNELVGVSVRTIVVNVFVQFVILLYLLDNNQETSWMILFGQGTGMLIEAWKVTKAVDIRVIQSPAGARFPYALKITDKHVLSEDEKKTQEYDALAFRYVSYVAIPLLAGYTVYSLIYESHKGWYSFIISTLTSFVYMFGFVQLVPQLIINWKLKSVAHMPMKAMIYKTLSTVVDDFFAFCIKMPFLHRLACFRDDVVFVVFLYQRWIYRVDPKRVNEFGQVLVTEEEKAAKEAVIENKKDK